MKKPKFPLFCRCPQCLTKEALELFREEIDNKGAEIDEENELDWYSITIGWAIAKGFTPKESLEIATYIRYNTDMG